MDGLMKIQSVQSHPQPADRARHLDLTETARVHLVGGAGGEHGGNVAGSDRAINWDGWTRPGAPDPGLGRTTT
jgi:hypothetical protein